jgi:hypothetical protein
MQHDAASKYILAATRALNDLKFYQLNYEVVTFQGLGRGRQVILGKKPFRCRFCDGANRGGVDTAFKIPEGSEGQRIVAYRLKAAPPATYFF